MSNPQTYPHYPHFLLSFYDGLLIIKQTYVLNQLTDQNKLTVILDEDAVPHDSYTYQWFNYEGTNPDDGPSAGDIAIGNATSSAFLPTTRDTYYVVVTNHLNGTQKTTVSPFYFVS